MSRSKKVGIITLFIIIILVVATFFSLKYMVESGKQKEFSTDINMDGITDDADKLLLDKKFGLACKNCREDINGDSKVDVEDMLILVGALND